MQASHSAPGNSGWIEICGGEDGSFFIQADQDGEGQDPSHDCNDCSLCAVSWNGANAVPATKNDVIQLSTDFGFAFPQHFNVVADCPEKHWSTSRAPPDQSANRKTILSNAFTFRPLQNAISDGAPTIHLGIL